MSGHQNRQQTKAPERARRRALQRSPVLFSPSGSGRRGISTGPAFTLIELLVVIAIIGILAAIGLPAMRGFGKSNALTSATGQLQDDVTLARQRAISGHTDVYIVFIPPGIANYPLASLTFVNDRTFFTNLVRGQFTTYALFSFRSVGEQPGRTNPRYLTAWRTLPEGMFIATAKFSTIYWPTTPDYSRPFAYKQFPFPSATNRNFALPYIAFNYQGKLVSEQLNDGLHDCFLPLARGSIFYDRNPDGSLVIGPADVKETPPGNSITSSNQIHIEWLTGRARVESQQIQ
jgi:prepilin-type N-terminal cleavage/methylation domain-containing protein